MPSRGRWRGWLSLAAFPIAAVIIGIIVISLSIPTGPPIPAPGGRAAPERGFYRLRSGTEMVVPGDPLFAEPGQVRLERLDGTAISGGELGSGSFLIAFWASVCPACDADAGALARVIGAGTAEDVPAVGIWVGTRATFDAWSVADAVRDLTFFDATGSSLDQQVVFGAPTHLLVVDGHIVERHLGPLDADGYRAAVARLAGDPSGVGGTPWP